MKVTDEGINQIKHLYEDDYRDYLREVWWPG
jgi:hypothetical protein